MSALSGGPRRVTVRLPTEDAARLAVVAASLGVTESEAMRRCVRDARPVVVSTEDAEAIKECNRLLAKIGGNLNQVAHRLNSGTMSASRSDDVASARTVVSSVGMAVSETREVLVALSAKEGARVREALSNDRA